MEFGLKSTGKYRLAESKVGLYGNLWESRKIRFRHWAVEVTDRYARVAADVVSTRLGKWLMETSGSSGEGAQHHLFSLRMQANLALSSNRHLPQHQFITGGTGSVRGYPESPAAGDHGYFASIEYRIPIFLSEARIGGTKLVWSAIPFLDFGKTFVNRPFFCESDQSLFGAGLGFEFQMPYGMLARFDFAKPLRELSSAGVIRDGTKSGDYRVHGLFRWNF